MFKLKIIYGRSVFSGDNATEIKEIRNSWRELVNKIGKLGILKTVDYLISGHASVPSYPPSIVEFHKCYKTYVAPYLKYLPGDMQ